MSDTIIGALIGLFGTVMLGPLVIFLIGRWRERNSRLVVTYMEGETFTYYPPQDPPVIPNSGDTVDQTRAALTLALIESKRAVDRLSRVNGCATLDLVNRSSRSLINLTLVPDTAMILKIGDNEPIEVAADTEFSLGSVQPSRSLKIQALYKRWSASSSTSAITQRFQFSADEIGGVTFKYPLPEYLKTRRRDAVSKWLLWIAGIWGAVTIAAQFVKK